MLFISVPMFAIQFCIIQNKMNESLKKLITVWYISTEHEVSFATYNVTQVWFHIHHLHLSCTQWKECMPCFHLT